MAYTATILRQTVFGNERVIHYLVTADAVSGIVSTGLSFIDSIQTTINSMTTTTAMRAKANLNISSAAANGTVFFSSVGASGDSFYLTVYGR